MASQLTVAVVERHANSQLPTVAVASSNSMDNKESQLERGPLHSRLRHMFSAKQLYECLQPLYFAAYWHGLTPFYICSDKSGNKKISQSCIGYLNAVCHIVVYSFCYVMTLVNNCESVVGYFFRSEISYFGDFMQILSGFIGITVIYLNVIVPKQRLQRCLRTLHHLDTQLQSVGVKIMYTKMLRFSYINIFGMALANVCYTLGSLTLLYTVEVVPSVWLHITFILQHTVIALAVTIFSCLTKLVESRFIMLHEELLCPSDAYAAVQTLLLLFFVLGLTPFRLHGQPGNRRITASRLGYLNTMLQLIFFMFCFIYSFVQQESIVGYFFKSEISKVGDTLQKFIGMTGMLILFGISLGQCGDVICLLHTIARIDQRFLDLGVEYNYSYIMRFTHTKLFVVISVNVSYIGSSLWLLFRNDIWPSLQALVTFFMPHVFFLSVVVLFLTFVMRLWQHFNLLNKVLKNLSQQWDNRNRDKSITQKQRSLQCLDSFSMYTIVTKNPSEIIQESMEIHQFICEAAATANKYFTYQLLTIISIAFLIIVFDAYYVLETLLGKSKRESKFKTIEFVTFFSCQMILYLIAIISIVEGSNRAIKKSEKTGSIVHSLLNKAKAPEVKEKLQQFSMQLLHLKINFTAAGLFNIDRTLYFTISGALTTYLIILLQFTSSTPTALPLMPLDGNALCAVAQNITNATIA